MGDIARSYITMSRQLSSHGRYDKAFELYVLAFNRYPSIKTMFESEFRIVLNRVNETLASLGKLDEVFANFGIAMNIFPENIYLLNDIGKFLYKFEYYTVAWCHFQNALKIDSGFVDAERNLNSVKNLMVERWHFRMLNDKIRNEAYHAAIQETVIPAQDSVLDIGTGSGLLALYANECIPLAITACEGSHVMANLAQVIMEENQAQEVVIINKMSTDMDSSEIGGRRSLLVTEVFDSGLLGEHVLQSLSHAWNNLIADSGKVIPHSAEFFVMGAKCDHLYMKYQLRQSAKSLLKIPKMAVHTLTFGDTYDCTDMSMYKDVKYMTEAHSLLKIDFNNPDDIQQVLQQREPVSVPLTATQTGEINIIIGWFNLHLTKNIIITTNPKSENRANAWQQAVFLDFVSHHIEQNEILETQFLINEGKMTLLSDNLDHVTRVSPETLRFLNDIEYTKKIKDCIAMACVYFGQLIDISQIDVADLCPFPLFGLLMLQRGARSLVCCAKSLSDKKFFKKVFKANKIPQSKVKFLLEGELTIVSFAKEKYHAIFCNVFELCGDIDLNRQELAYHLKENNLHRAGLFIPATVQLMGQLVDSPWLDRQNRVYDENVSNYKIAMHVNKFQVSQNYCLDLTTMDFTVLSAPVILATFTNTMVSGVVSVPIVNDGNANAILCWYSIVLVKDMGEIQTNRSDSFIESMAFLADPTLPTLRGGSANILRCVDCNGSFKLMIDIDTT
ncbi:protein arginine N-methyltransferase 9-like [Cydia fagiglandana]|uniref:protein arginine N-methyltransferase 9-like n=1 Tax=Cydia fagiglandana TaxID=1458189 RepID=UPI002FEE5749